MCLLSLIGLKSAHPATSKRLAAASALTMATIVLDQSFIIQAFNPCDRCVTRYPKNVGVQDAADTGFGFHPGTKGCLAATMTRPSRAKSTLTMAGFSRKGDWGSLPK